MSRVRVPLPFRDQLDVWGDRTRREMHEAVVSAKVRSVPIAALVSTQKTVGSEMLDRYLHGKGKTKHEPIVVPSADGAAIYDGHHRVTSAVKRGERTIRARVASTGPRPPRMFRPDGLLMMQPQATTVSYPEYDVQDVAELHGDIAVICIDTPLESKASAYGWGYFDDYESLLCRFENAINSEEVRSVLLKIDSPGGAAQGLNACVDAMIKAKKKAGKPVIAFADEGAYSAAYALACVADAIYLPKAGGLGSIGVIARIVDVTEADKKDGIRVETITTGKRKADGDPHVPVSKEAIAHLQRRVDGLGELYFKLVAEARDGLDARSLQADTYYGKDAVKQGLADKVMSLDHLVKRMATDLDKLPGLRLATSSTSLSAEARTRMNLTQLAAALDAAVAEGDKKKIATARAALEAGIAAGKKVVTTETKSTESSESSESSDEGSESEEEEEKESMPEASESSGSSSSSESEEEEEEEEEEAKEEEKEKAAAKIAAKSLAHATSGTERRRIVAAAIKEIVGPLRAVAKAAAKATGRKSLSSIAGALAAMPKQREATGALRKEIDALKADKVRAKVDARLDKALRAGKIVPAQKEALRSQGMKDPKWLKGYLATLPKQVHATGGGFVPRSDAKGGAVIENADQEKIRAAATAHMTDAERAEFDKTRAELDAKLHTNGAPRI